MSAQAGPPGPSRRSLLTGVAALAAVPAAAQAPVKPAEPEFTTWTAAPRRVRLRAEPAAASEIWTLAEEAPPTLRVKLGEELRLRLVNDTPKPLSLHWHGVRGAAAMDGVGGLTQPPVAPGRALRLPLHAARCRHLPDPARSCPAGAREPAGAASPACSSSRSASRRRSMRSSRSSSQDWRLRSDGRARALRRAARRRRPPAGSATGSRSNGRPAPRRSRPRRARGSGCGSPTPATPASMRIRFDGLKAYVAAVDGQPTDTFEPLRATLPFAPGTRYDLVFDLPRRSRRGRHGRRRSSARACRSSSSRPTARPRQAAARRSPRSADERAACRGDQAPERAAPRPDDRGRRDARRRRASRASPATRPGLDDQRRRGLGREAPPLFTVQARPAGGARRSTNKTAFTAAAAPARPRLPPAARARRRLGALLARHLPGRRRAAPRASPSSPTIPAAG